MDNRFQIVLGYYVFCLFWHNGQGCRFYERMCRIEKYFNPGHAGLDLDTPGNELAKEIYERLVEEHTVPDAARDT